MELVDIERRPVSVVDFSHELQCVLLEERLERRSEDKIILEATARVSSWHPPRIFLNRTGPSVHEVLPKIA